MTQETFLTSTNGLKKYDEVSYVLNGNRMEGFIEEVKDAKTLKVTSWKGIITIYIDANKIQLQY